jgi:hypothetical protein
MAVPPSTRGLAFTLIHPVPSNLLGTLMFSRLTPIMAGAALTAWILSAPAAHADGGWVAAASSPSHEQAELVWGATQADAESRALGQCAVLERASDCILLASGPDCVAIAWGGHQPINHAHAVSGGGREVVLRAALAAAGPHANGCPPSMSDHRGDRPR